MTRRPASLWLIAGRCCAALGWVLWVVVQIIAKDPFPPEISESQYGLGGLGWVFTAWALALAAAPPLLQRAAPVPGPARWLQWIGFAGAVVMALVRTDEGGGPMSWHARTHTVAAVVALIFLPLGMLAALRFADRRSRRIAGVLAVAGIAAALLVLVSAVGIDTTGLGAPESWALWEGTLIVVDMLLVALCAVAAGRVTTRMSAVRADG